MWRHNAGKTGTEAWRLICDRFDPKGPMIAEALAERLSSIEWPKTSDGITSLFDSIGVMIREYADMNQEEYSEATQG